MDVIVSLVELPGLLVALDEIMVKSLFNKKTESIPVLSFMKTFRIHVNLFCTMFYLQAPVNERGCFHKQGQHSTV